MFGLSISELFNLLLTAGILAGILWLIMRQFSMHRKIADMAQQIAEMKKRVGMDN